VCYLKAFQAIGFRITPESLKEYKKQFIINTTDQNKSRKFTLNFDYKGGQLDHLKLYVFYNQIKYDEKNVLFKYTWKISAKGIHLFRWIKNLGSREIVLFDRRL
jgi:hypothetical protein